jgi:uncharacterized membrane protein YhhN
VVRARDTMDTINWGLSLAAAIAAALTIRANYAGPAWHIYVFKPAATALILVLAWRLPAPEGLFFHACLLTGLGFSLLGDVVLMLPGERWFLAGLVSFLLAHLAYIAAFAPAARLASASLLRLAPFALAGLVLFRVLAPGMGKMRGPVAVYLAALATMAWLAFERAAAIGTWPAWLAAVGAAFFLVSDGVLAYERFRRPFPAARLVVLITYWVAQWLIALAAA